MLTTKQNMSFMMKIVHERLKNAIGKVENAAYQVFFHNLQCFCKLYSSGLSKHGISGKELSSLPKDKFLERVKLSAFAVDNVNVAALMIPIFDRVENTVRKGENAGNKHFLLHPHRP